MTGTTKLTAAQARDRVEELEGEIEDLQSAPSFVVNGARITYDRLTFANGWVELDVCGHITAVHLGQGVTGSPEW